MFKSCRPDMVIERKAPLRNNLSGAFFALSNELRCQWTHECKSSTIIRFLIENIVYFKNSKVTIYNKSPIEGDYRENLPY
ncbi:hypothetical protein GCM10008013_32410 [Paenibacillus segetis]|uniref:Uncharacterized protein n=1 Tax=Paenibacillus segetis TaxID=1325360 RepID=A0ABQ1YML2_9BACL|nr:hypothetical protein GCM10008013_32410 [Paenibacillus segetis]